MTHSPNRHSDSDQDMQSEVPITKREETPSLQMCIRATELCTCYNPRKLSRAVTQIYDDALRPLRLRSGQFVILLAARIAGSSTIRELADIIGLDRSALSRNLKPMEEKGMIVIKPGPDRRTRWVSLTRLGMETLNCAYPEWEKIQDRVSQVIGSPETGELLRRVSSCLDRIYRSQDLQKTA